MKRRFQKLERKPYYMATRVGPINYLLARSSRRSSIEISVTDSCEVKVSAPRYSSDREIKSFISEKAHWIIDKLKEAKQSNKIIESKQYIDNFPFYYLGSKYPLKISIKNNQKFAKIQFDGQKWNVSIPDVQIDDQKQELVRDKLIKWYRNEAKEIFGSRVFHYSRLMGLEPLKISVKTQKRIWGNCDYHRKAINLNWYLILAPMEVIDYVIVHELCHLEIPSHSRRFWKKVEKHMPEYKIYQKWLKEHSLDMVLP